MHPVLFSIKRAYWRSQLTMRPLAEAHGLTPARFDLMHAISVSSPQVRLGTLCQVVGCHRTTVSKMLRSLEELGLVGRARDARNRRAIFVVLTKVGRMVLKRAVRHLLRRRAGRWHVRKMLDVSSRGLVRVAAPFDALLRRVERRLEGTSAWLYAWTPRERELRRAQPP